MDEVSPISTIDFGPRVAIEFCLGINVLGGSEANCR